MLNWLFKNRGKKNAAGALTEEQKRLQERVDQYVWYHEIELEPGVRTKSEFGGYHDSWAFIKAALANVDFAGKRVLDVGCRDGMFSFEAERRGASEIDGIDNDLSAGAVELLVPHFNSRVTMRKLNLYQLNPTEQTPYDVIMFFGVLYHLRYPALGLRRLVDCLAMGGELLIESGMLIDTAETETSELIYCPVENSPYEHTSCTFYNRRGLETTLRWFGMELIEQRVQPGTICKAKAGPFSVERRLLRFRKRALTEHETGISFYWESTHSCHSVDARQN